MGCLLRPAEPNERDQMALARGLEAASDGMFTLLFGAAAESILAAACAVAGQASSLDHATLAEDEGRVVGLLSGMPGTEAGDPNRILMRTAGPAGVPSRSRGTRRPGRSLPPWTGTIPEIGICRQSPWSARRGDEESVPACSRRGSPRLELAVRRG